MPEAIHVQRFPRPHLLLAPHRPTDMKRQPALVARGALMGSMRDGCEAASRIHRSSFLDRSRASLPPVAHRPSTSGAAARGATRQEMTARLNCPGDNTRVRSDRLVEGLQGSALNMVQHVGQSYGGLARPAVSVRGSERTSCAPQCVQSSHRVWHVSVVARARSSTSNAVIVGGSFCHRFGCPSLHPSGTGGRIIESGCPVMRATSRCLSQRTPVRYAAE
jgi:hypothetical protein